MREKLAMLLVQQPVWNCVPVPVRFTNHTGSVMSGVVTAG
jgi:hypothetical protein